WASWYSWGSRVSIRTTSPPAISSLASKGSISSICCVVSVGAIVLLEVSDKYRNSDQLYFKKYSEAYSGVVERDDGEHTEAGKRPAGARRGPDREEAGLRDPRRRLPRRQRFLRDRLGGRRRR